MTDDAYAATSMNPTRIGSAIAEVSATLNTDFDLPLLLSAIVDHARVGLDASSAAVVLLDRRKVMGQNEFHVVAEAVGSGAAGLDLETEGPATLSASEGVVAMIDDLAGTGDTRWLEYRRRALASGVRSVRAFPIVSLQVPLGAVVVHADQPWGSARSHAFGQTLANLTAVALTSAVVEHRRTDTADTIDELLEGGVAVAAAMGMLAEVLRLDVAEARVALGRLARAHGASETAYARVIVESHNADPSATEPAWARPPELDPPGDVDG